MKEHSLPHTTTNTEKLHDAMTSLNEAAHASTGWIKHKGEAVADTAKKAASTVNDSVHKHPWPYIGSVALGALILGFLLGRRR